MTNLNLSPEEVERINEINIVGEHGWTCGECIHIDTSSGNVYLRNNMFEMGIGPLYQSFGRVSLEALSNRDLFHEKTRFEEGFDKNPSNFMTLQEWSHHFDLALIRTTIDPQVDRSKLIYE